MDPHAQRTMLRGIVGGFIVYALGLAAMFLLAEPFGVWLSLGLTAGSMVFVLGWYVAVKRGYRVGKPPSKVTKRAKQKQAAEREKLRKLRLRR